MNNHIIPIKQLKKKLRSSIFSKSNNYYSQTHEFFFIASNMITYTYTKTPITREVLSLVVLYCSDFPWVVETILSKWSTQTQQLG